MPKTYEQMVEFAANHICCSDDAEVYDIRDLFMAVSIISEMFGKSPRDVKVDIKTAYASR